MTSTAKKADFYIGQLNGSRSLQQLIKLSPLVPISACDVVRNVFLALFLRRNVYSDPCSKHILNAQVSIRAPCCKQWFDCAECHAETQDHQLNKTTEMAFICKKCKKAFRKDMANYEESDEYCPHCDNHYVSADRLRCDVHACVRALRMCVGRSSKQRRRRPCSVSRVRMHE